MGFSEQRAKNSKTFQQALSARADVIFLVSSLNGRLESTRLALAHPARAISL